MIVIKKKHLCWLAGIFFVAAMIVGLLPQNYEYPPEHRINNFPTAQQPDSITCGPTSAAMVLRHYGHESTVDEVKELTKTHWYGTPGNEVGMTAPDYITTALNKFGLKARLKNDDLEEVKFEVSQNRPVIVLVRSGKKTWHYMVAIGYNEKEMIFSDPGGGYHRTVSKDNFFLAWNHDGNCEGEDYRTDSFFGKTSDYMKILFRATEIRPKTYIVISAP